MIKLIAVDMDGTFLDENKKYNRRRFLDQYRRLTAAGIKFVVASGNQYYQLLSFFPDIAGEISFVAENGAYVVTAGEPVFVGEFSAEQVARVMAALADIPGANTVVCGKNSAYTPTSAPDDFITLMSKHYRRLQKTDDVLGQRDTIFKFALNLPEEQIPALMEHVGHTLDGIVQPVSSGYGFVDLIIPGVHKAHGLTLLQRLWQIDSGEVVAIGDSGNDREMVLQSGYGFAMGNAQPAIKQAARYHTESNNEEGALNVIERVLTREPPFNQ